MKKYARLRPSAIDKFEERSNVLYNSRPEISLEEDPHQARPPPSDGSASPQRNSLPDFQIPRATQREDRPSSSGPSHTDLTEALKKLSSFREGGSRGNSGRWQGGGGGGNGEHRSRHGSGTWGASGVQEGGTSSGRWGPHDGSSGNLFVYSAFLSIFVLLIDFVWTTFVDDTIASYDIAKNDESLTRFRSDNHELVHWGLTWALTAFIWLTFTVCVEYFSSDRSSLSG